MTPAKSAEDIVVDTVEPSPPVQLGRARAIDLDGFLVVQAEHQHVSK